MAECGRPFCRRRPDGQHKSCMQQCHPWRKARFVAECKSCSLWDSPRRRVTLVMSWISPTFSGDEPRMPPPKSKKIPKAIKGEKESTGFSAPTCNWLEKYKPKNIGDLLVNVKKVKEVEEWLQQVNKNQSLGKVLLLTGPSGCGKTTTLQTVCKSMGVRLLEWVTPLDRPAEESTEFPSKFEFSKSAAKQFEEYVLKSSRYNSCLVSSSSKKIILVKDLPNIFIHNPSSFHDVLERFSQLCINPIVFISSDDSICRKLFPASTRDNATVHTIAFNPITDQKMIKFMKNMLAQEVKVRKGIKMLPDEAISTICASSHGDLRSAVSKLYFCSITSDFDLTKLKSIDKTKTLKKSDTSVETNKDKRLDFFRGIGRVLYPKKINTKDGMRFEHSTSEIVDNFISEPHSFLSQLHENYPTKMGSVLDLKDAAERLSRSDILMSRWQEKDIFPEYALSVAVQGVMVSNRNPQKTKFEAFRRSQTSRLEIDTKALQLEGKAIFSDLFILEYERLIDILPYSRFLLPKLNVTQLDYITKTCYFRRV